MGKFIWQEGSEDNLGKRKGKKGGLLVKEEVYSNYRRGVQISLH